MSPKVYIINKAAHDFSPASRYGEIIYLSKGGVNKYAVNNIFRMFRETLEKSSADDYILITSLTVMSCIACCIMVMLHSRLNLLLFMDGDYVERKMDFTDLRKEKEK
jgi:hypothetical protein